MREPVTVWAAVILGLAIVQAIGLAVPFVHSLTGALAVAAFLYVPVRMLEKRGQDAHDAGWRFDRLGADLAWSLGASALVLPLFTAAFWMFPRWLAVLPAALRALLAPYAGAGVDFRFPFTLDFAGQVAGNAAVAFSEEFFYRGYLTMRFEERLRPVPSALLAAALFAVGHLLTPAPWRLAVFFPALLFAFLRNRTRTIVGASVCHFLCNVWLLVLQS
ncbi:MAG: type II CAAX prenyl endopeptidase Rce1 family protein [Myxococcales bacterium]|nr:CPBP family intramembrane metalloprotease [Myxococcales bacterium]